MDQGGIVSKLSEYVKVALAAEILVVSQGTVRTWAADGIDALPRLIDFDETTDHGN